MQHRLWLTIVLAVFSLSLVVAAAPNPPHSLAAAVAGNTVTLTWLAPSTGAVPASYAVDASLSPGGPLIASFPVASTSLVVNSVPNGVYYVRVRALNVDGSSAASNEVVVVVPGGGSCTSPPNAPTNLTSNVFGVSVTLNWLAPAGGCPAAGYVVQAGSAPGLSNLAVINLAGSATTLSVTAPPGTYYVRVIALNGFGGSVASNEVVIAVTTTPPNLAGHWSGTSNYFNAPFTFDLTQSGNGLSGRYRDQHDQGFVSGIVNIGSVIIDVNFGDTGIRFEGSIENANRIRGIIRGSVIGGPYTFVMTR
jgi:predicted phage tail protein